MWETMRAAVDQLVPRGRARALLKQMRPGGVAPLARREGGAPMPWPLEILLPCETLAETDATARLERLAQALRAEGHRAVLCPREADPAPAGVGSVETAPFETARTRAWSVVLVD